MVKTSIFAGLVALLMSGLLVGAALAAPVNNISPAEARELIQKHPQVYLLDVRSPGEYQQVRLAGAHLIPIDQFVARLAEVPKNKPVLVYCAVGARSSQVANYLAQLGYKDIYNMSGGVMGWQVRGYPVVQGAP